MTSDFGAFTIAGAAPAADDVDFALAPRRTVLDAALVPAAVAEGVELRERFTVEDLIWRDGVVGGIRGRVGGGHMAEEQARVVVGEDGVRTLVARRVAAPAYREVASLIAFYYSYWSSVEHEGIEMYSLPRRGVGLIPTNDGLVCVGVA